MAAGLTYQGVDQTMGLSYLVLYLDYETMLDDGGPGLRHLNLTNKR